MKRVLVVDDSIAVTRQLEKIINAAGGCMCVGKAGNGLEAIRMNHSENPDIIFMDVNMPDMDGLTALRSLMMLDREVKVVVVSSMASAGDRFADAIRLGAVRTIAKPFDTQDILEVLHEL